MGKRRIAAREQDVLILTATNGMELCSIDTNVLHAASPDTIEAWELDPNQQAKSEKTGRYLQVVCEHSKKPIQVFRNKPTLNSRSTDSIYSQRQDEELTFMEKKSAKNAALLWLGIITALLAVIIGLIVLLNMHKSSTMGFILPMLGAVATQNKNGKNKEVSESKDDLAKLFEPEVGAVSAFVFSDKTRTYDLKKISTSLIPEGSREREYKGKPCYIIGFDDNGPYPIEPPTEIAPGDSPQDCYMALELEQEVNEVYGMNDSLTEKIKLGIFYFLIIFFGIILFFIATIAMGGQP